MDPQRKTRLSKYLSFCLRHKPAQIGLSLGPGGWVEVEALLDGCAADDHPLTREDLDEIVASCPKQRFSFDEGGEQIRANQGHSVAVDLQLPPQQPPELLFHGTATRFLEAIRQEGLKRRSRHHVHLSPDEDTARKVGSRHGKPVMLRVRAGAMHAAGHAFFRAENGVWLVEAVPAEFLDHA